MNLRTRPQYRHITAFLFLLLAASLFSEAAWASNGSPKSVKTAASHSVKTSATSAEISQARAKGLVWVNTRSHVYHTGGRYYGKTKQGRFMSLADARKAGYRAARR